MRYRVFVADPDTGRESSIDVTADSSDSAMQTALGRGWLVTQVSLAETTPPPMIGGVMDRRDWKRLERTITTGVFKGIIGVVALYLLVRAVIALLEAVAHPMPG